jgi:hypothetical protein
MEGYGGFRDGERDERLMIWIALLTLAIAWLGVLSVIVGVCVSAAQGDRAFVATAAAARTPVQSEPPQLRLIA